MFGWLRKRRRPADQTDAVEQDGVVDDAIPVSATESTPEPPAAPLVAAPARRPSMPLSARPNVVGVGLPPGELAAPRLLDPAAALTPEAREELTALMTDMFGARGRYRLEWRADRAAGDDAMFSEIMVADLVRRIQNSIAVVAELEQPAPFLAIEAKPESDASTPEDPEPSRSDDTDEVSDEPAARADDAHDAESTEAATTGGAGAEAARMAAIEAFFSPPETLEDIAAALQPDPERLHDDSSEVEGDRRIA